MLERWHKRPITVLAILCMLLALAVAAMPQLAVGTSGDGGQSSWDVIIEHFGISSEEMERSITNDLEESLSALAACRDLRSVSEFGKSRVTVSCDDAMDPADFFLALRDSVDSVWRRLPSSVQKPRIVASGSRQEPVFIVSFDVEGWSEGQLRDWVEKEVKPAFEKLEGAGELEVGGGEVKEVHVLLDEQRASALGLTWEMVARFLQSQNLQLPAGTWRSVGIASPMVVREIGRAHV